MQFEVLVFAILATGAFASNDKKVQCIHQKYTQSIGTAGYTTCYNQSSHLAIPRIKKCFDEVMKQKGVVKIAADKQMTVDKDKFKEFGTSNSNNEVGKGVTACYNKNDDRIYREVARASQCVFDQVKKGCKA